MQPNRSIFDLNEEEIINDIAQQYAHKVLMFHRVDSLTAKKFGIPGHIVLHIDPTEGNLHIPGAIQTALNRQLSCVVNVVTSDALRREYTLSDDDIASLANASDNLIGNNRSSDVFICG